MASSQSFSLRNWATPLVIGSFAITGASGVMLFFHFGESLIKEAHEWIGILMAIGVLIHLKLHLAPLKRYFSKPVSIAVMLAAVIAGGSMVAASASSSSGSPVAAVMHSVEEAPLSLVARLQQRDAKSLVTQLESAGYVVIDTEESIETIAAANQRSTRELIPLLFSGQGD